jgi:hypothetical protein
MYVMRPLDLYICALLGFIKGWRRPTLLLYCGVLAV